MANKPANTVQRKWMSDVYEYCDESIMEAIYGFRPCKGVELHHVLGRSAKHNKVAIGHEFIILAPHELHNIHSNHINNVSHFKHNFTDAYGKQSDIFKAIYQGMLNEGYAVPSLEKYKAIMDTGV